MCNHQASYKLEYCGSSPPAENGENDKRQCLLKKNGTDYFFYVRTGLPLPPLNFLQARAASV